MRRQQSTQQPARQGPTQYPTAGEAIRCQLQGRSQRVERLGKRVLHSLTLVGQRSGERDPEDIHDLRVALRRLRSAIAIFGPLLPEGGPRRGQGAGGKLAASLKRFNRKLGAVRDWDVLLEQFRAYGPGLPEGEQAALQMALGVAAQRQQQSVGRLLALMGRDAYGRLGADVRQWLALPYSHPLAQIPLGAIAPDLWLGLAAGVNLHPAWGIGGPELCPQDYGVLHDLRKRVKALRYGLEAIYGWGDDEGGGELAATARLGAGLSQGLALLKQIQTALGQINDIQVQATLLPKLLAKADADWSLRVAQERMPQLMARLQQEGAIAWADWRVLCDRYGVNGELLGSGGAGGVRARLVAALVRDP